MKIAPRTEAQAQRAASAKLLPAGWHDARITEAIEKLSKAGKPMIELTSMVPDADGNERTLRDWLTANDRAALKFRHAAEAVGALAQYDSGEIGEADFPVGHALQVKISVEKRRGYPDSNRIDDYRAADSGVVRLRAG